MITLRKLLLAGNPLRTLRSSLVNGPTTALLKYLRSRLPKDEESAAPSAVKQDPFALAAQSSLTSKVDLLLESGEYFLSDQTNQAKKWQEKQVKQAAKVTETKRKREEAFL
ncbi:plant intracellular Ras-group-related LRR protein 6-like [Salvia miltiorrhiza]|uniref:plant intracellular Ras-group-related LRR protein 6-like n=1 Tax=Salvia miltiorrhiza TaxID=226208 RepID=UPI0025ACB961|nr:plant intracellular Ras-group-related LRR protein 6-like [Salvia miltiorrhiza]XP_057799648.1 plant intracellular Ras-group-related LRR protein 6-like [Salvia miltiorrhiza]XP_057799649.1 plant intracellular Ras-group-related LRR protein 6-like [Salvia miltiorrhiza]XP_057799650.1 plant intracellular Ras-group-related LRR protein 6-like [Salvia miltiorrhiza]XP_057807270.1 plant intracellular Ras-group-related LRR protein 6-like [Salvia miltiorrhiza]XP_057807271.1 plant intracellular Ras-group-